MSFPVQINFRHMDVSPAAESRIREEAGNLARYFDRIVSCHVVVDAPHHHQLRGTEYHIIVTIHVPGKEINVSHEPSRHRTLAQTDSEKLTRQSETQNDHGDIYVCIRDAFAAARRQLEDYARLLRGDVKHRTGNDQPLIPGEE
jgi:ribosome-associated translation inhibitor RaiA